MKKTKRLAVLAMAAVMTASALTASASAYYTTIDPWVNGGQWSWGSDWSWWPSSGGGSSSGSSGATDSASLNRIPRRLYMTCYKSNPAARTAVAQSRIDEAAKLVNQVKTLPNAAFDGVTLSFNDTIYDHLAKVDDENGTTILTFNSQSNLESAMKKILAEEQTLINDAFKPYVAYINGLLNGDYVKYVSTDTEEQKTTKTANKALLEKAKSLLSYTYDKSDLFDADSVTNSRDYLTIYLTTASSSGSVTTSISNKSDLDGFPRIIVDGNTIDWDNIEHVDVTSKSNNSWWFALKDGNTSNRTHYKALTNDYYWLKGMVVPNITPVIAFGADFRDWQPYEATITSSSNSYGDDNSRYDYTSDDYIYYNSRYHYASEFVYIVTNGSSVCYYPNLDYANAACSTGDSYIVKAVASTHSEAAPYFCFVNGKYYTSINASAYPAYTAKMAIPDTTSNPDTSSLYGQTSYYYLHENNVYNYDGKLMGAASSRGYDKTKGSIWFCVNDGKFYTGPQTGKTGFFVSSTSSSDNSGSATVSPTDPYYEYWHAKLTELEAEITKKLAELDDINKRIDDAKKNEKNTKTDSSKDTTVKNDDAASDSAVSITQRYKNASSAILYVTAAELADIRANYTTVTIKAKNNTLWTIHASDIKTPKLTNLRVIYKTNNIPDSLRKRLLSKKDVVATTQITIGENIAWSWSGSVRLKYTTKYANYYATLYRYDSKTGSLVLVDESTMDKKGYLTFNNISHGGDYIITFG